jgi:cytochrome b561
MRRYRSERIGRDVMVPAVARDAPQRQLHGDGLTAGRRVARMTSPVDSKPGDDVPPASIMTPAAKTRAPRFDGVAMALHWASALLVLGLMGTGLVMTRLAFGSPEQFALYQLHKSLGVSLLVLVIARLAWRALRPPPPLPADVSHRLQATARVAHALLYVGLVAIPLVGWAMVSVSVFNIPTRLFGLVTWPHLPGLPDLDVASRARLEPVLSHGHALLAYGLAGLVVLHAAAALWHGRRVLGRMLPGVTMRKGAG